MSFFNSFNKTKKNSKKSAEDKILESFIKSVHKINVISPLNNKSSVFNKVLECAIREGKKVLYIINKDKETLDLSKNVVNYIDSPVDKINKYKINMCNYNIALYIEEKFDLIIYDEINSRPMYSNESICKLMNSLCSSYGTMISYSVESIFKNGLTIYNLKEDFRTPIAEPRFITTRINLEEEIPNGVYEYLKWSINSNNKIIIYVPDKDKVDKVYKNLNEIKSKLTVNLFRRRSDDPGRKRLIKFLLAEEGILITDDFSEEYIGLKAVNIMVFFADSNTFNYKDLVYISSRVNRILKNTKEEVIFISNNETDNMDRCRSILRELNKKAWEEGFFKK